MRDPVRPESIPLDYNATTSVHHEVVDAMLPYLRTHWGNPSSAHALGHQPRRAVDEARASVASLIGARPDEIVFTSCGTEADNWALFGCFPRPDGDERNVIVHSAIEHPAITEAAMALTKLGVARTAVLPVDRDAQVSLEGAQKIISKKSVVVSVMHAHNESGTIQPVRTVADLAHENGALMHCDAAQSVGKIPVNVDELGVDLLSLVGHKIYAPKGIAALYIRRGTPFGRFLFGGGQEGGRRGGTENVPYIVGFGVAARMAAEGLEKYQDVERQRDAFQAVLKERLGGRFVVIGKQDARLPNTLYGCFRDVIARDALAKCKDLCISTGSACHDGESGLSALLNAVNAEPALGPGAVRISLGCTQSDRDMSHAANALASAVLEVGPQ